MAKPIERPGRRRRGVRSPASSRVHDGLASLFAKSRLKVLSIVFGQIVACNRLTAILVNSLKDLVTGCVTETWEQRDELSTQRSASLVLENNLVQLARTGNLGVVRNRIVSSSVASFLSPVYVICRGAQHLVSEFSLLVSGCSLIASQSYQPGQIMSACLNNHHLVGKSPDFAVRGEKLPTRRYQRSLQPVSTHASDPG